ncbi:hypothetical protein L596_025666 [Steinernema carpocapsae]|uniref:Uncharacterized protein n=1 Tax=Steinernema carpocapsae TaxID=34508 RepID=A0A4V5ZZ51_STECR|nr:hypothetical protein L596_025666 [Steinernema carpocapsae]
MSGPAAVSTSSFVPDRCRRDVPDISTRHSDPDATLRAVALRSAVMYLINVVFIPCCVPSLSSHPRFRRSQASSSCFIVIRALALDPRYHRFHKPQLWNCRIQNTTTVAVYKIGVVSTKFNPCDRDGTAFRFSNVYIDKHPMPHPS